MQQRRRVEQLHARGDLDLPRAVVATHLGRKEEERGADPLAARGENVVADEGHRLALGGELVFHRPLDMLETRFYPLEGFGDGGGKVAGGGRHRGGPEG